MAHALDGRQGRTSRSGPWSAGCWSSHGLFLQTDGINVISGDALVSARDQRSRPSTPAAITRDDLPWFPSARSPGRSEVLSLALATWVRTRYSSTGSRSAC